MMPARITPVAGVRGTLHDDGWECEPGALFELEGEAPTGWVRIRITIDAQPTAWICPTLHVDQGFGYFAADSVSLPVTPDGSVDAIVRLHDRVAGLRLSAAAAAVKINRMSVAFERLDHRAATRALLLRAVWRARSAPLRWTGRTLQAARTARTFGRSMLKSALAAQSDALVAGTPSHLDYEEWIRRYDTLTATDLEVLRAELDLLPARPLVSLRLVGNGKGLLERTVASLERQLYPEWELLVSPGLAEQPQGNPRVRFGDGQTASGELVGTIAAGDELPSHALAVTVQALQSRPATQLVYSDEDLIDSAGRRSHPWLKPSFSPRFLQAGDYTVRLGLRRVAAVREWEREGGPVPFPLWSLQRHGSASILHLPLVLYHRQSGRGAPPNDLSPQAPPAPSSRQRRNPRPSASIIVPTRNALPLVRQCIESLDAHPGEVPFELILVDNQSDDPAALAYFAQLAAAGARVLRYDQPFNYSAINNFAVSHAKGEVVVLLNNDVQVLQRTWLEELTALALDEDVGAVGTLLWYPNGLVQHGGVVLGLGGVADHFGRGLTRARWATLNEARSTRECSAVTAACLAIRRDVFQAVQGLDERLTVAYNDVDLCLRLRQRGLSNLFTPAVQLIHHESATRGRDDSPEKRARFAGEVRLMKERWGALLECDPYYSPNRTVALPDASLAWPPRTVPPWRRTRAVSH